MSNYLVTGGAGFIGSHIVETLLARGETVRVLDNFLTGRRENVALFAGRIELVEGSIEDAAACARAVEGIDYILHEAALPSVPRSVNEPILSDGINVRGTLNMLIAASKAGVKRLVFAGSSSVYGDAQVSPKHEELVPRPKSPYAVQKLAGESYCRAAAEVYGIDTCVLRYFNVFGPRQDPKSDYAAVIPRFATALLRGQRPTIYGDGKQSRDFTYVANVVEANLLAATAPGRIGGEVFNAACGGEYSLLDLLATMQEILGTNIEPIFAPPRTGDVRNSRAQVTRAADRIGYKPVVDFREGLRRTLDYYRTIA